MKRALRILIDIFQPEGVDWMNFALARHNQYTFHHIVEKCNGGEKNIDNGAILTRKAHNFLNLLSYLCPEAYNDLNAVFRKINGTKKPVTKKITDEIDEIMYNLLYTEKYNVQCDVDLFSYCGYYFEGKKRNKRR